ncbi:MAG: signal peptidase I [Chloroflexi bacterium]|nr:signal peptidase I [Chloroflexota bacterium]
MRSAFRETIETIILTLLIFLVVRTVVQNFKVEGSSMEPTLHSEQYLLVNKASYFQVDLSDLIKLVPVLKMGNDRLLLWSFPSPQPGDVVVFRFPRDPRRDFIKRVVGRPGDTVEIRNSQVIINGKAVNEPYVREHPNYTLPTMKVPEDNYFVLGDNRNNSSDSHVWGVVPRENIVGKAWLVYWPMEQWGLIRSYSPVAVGQYLYDFP